jgi:hypothetical protein
MVKCCVGSLEFWAVLAVWTAGSLLYGTSLPLDYDSINYALAIVDKFDPSIHQPQPPGYFFHVMTGRALHLIIENPFRIQQVQNIAYMTVMLLALFCIPAGKGVRLFLSTLPLLLFFTGAPVIYGALVGFSALLCCQVVFVMRREGNPLTLVVTYALAIGFRQDLSLFLLPAVLYALGKYRPSMRQIVVMAALFAACTALWFIPTMAVSSRSPIASSSELFRTFAAGSSIFLGAPPLEALRWALRFVLYGLGAFGPAGIGYLVVCWVRAEGKDRLLLAIGVLPSLLSGLFIHAPKPGYFGVAVGFFLVWSLGAVRPVLRTRLWIALAGLNILFFALVPPMHLTSFENAAVENRMRKIANRLSAVGGSGAHELLRARAYMRHLDSTFIKRTCVDPEGVATDMRILSYLAKYRWHNTIATGTDRGCGKPEEKGPD